MTKVLTKTRTDKYLKFGKGAIDVGKAEQYCYIEAPNGNYLKTFKFKNNLAGFQKCLEKLKWFQKEEGLEGILLGIESTGTYGDALASWLIRKGIKVVGLNPKHVNRMRELVDNSPLKSDRKDPITGTMVLKTGQFFNLLIPEGIAAELRGLSKHRRQLKTKETRIVNQLESHVVRVFPEFIEVMKGLDTKTAAYLLEYYPLPENLTSLKLEELTKTLRLQSRYQLGSERAQELLDAAKDSVGIKEGLVSISLAIKDLVSDLNRIRVRVKATEKMMKDLLMESEEAEYLLSVPNIGFVTACEIIGETGGLSNYSNSHKIIKIAGLNLYEMSSGKHVGLKRITKRGRGALRRTLYLAVLRMIGEHGIFRKQYEKYIQTMKKVQAIVAVAKKLLRTLFALVKKQEMFNIDCV